MAGWKYVIKAYNNTTSKETMALVKALRKNEFIAKNSIFDIEINGFNEWYLIITTDKDGVKEAIHDFIERRATGENCPTAWFERV